MGNSQDKSKHPKGFGDGNSFSPDDVANIESAFNTMTGQPAE